MGKNKDENKTPRCHCGNPLPCHRHTGDDGDEQDMYTSDTLRGNEGNRDN